MRRTEALIIGAGQAGLAMSRHLTDRGIDHVVVDRGQVGERWRSERWDSLRLLTPNWQTRLPGWTYQGPDPDGFMTMGELAAHLAAYAVSFDAPVWEHTTVERVRPLDDGYEVVTDRATWHADNVVIATGACDVPLVPAAAAGLDPRIQQLTPTRYRNPDQLADGGVLVVGASASGIQIADELAAAGRYVALAVGSHTRLPRDYRGRDIQWWLDEIGVWDTDIADIRDVAAARRAPSLQLIGTPERRSIDLASLHARGVRMMGRLEMVDGTRIVAADSLADDVARSDRRLHRLLDRIDAHVEAAGTSHCLEEAERPELIRLSTQLTALDLAIAGIRTVVWATGFRREYPWLDVDACDAAGELIHHRGVTPAPGLFALGLPMLMRRNSTFIDGVGRDAAELAEHIHERAIALAA